MLVNVWKVASVPVLAIAVFIFALNTSAAAKLPMGTYLNVDAGYGSAELTLLHGGRYTYGDDGIVSVEGTYALIQDEILFIEYGPADASCLHLPGKYQWSLDGKVLRLKAVADPCPTRQYDWSFGEWRKR